MKHLLITLSSIALCLPVIAQVDSLYLGQTPPGTSAQLFELEESSGYFITDRVAFSADGKTIVYSETTGGDWSNCKIKQYQYSEGEWQGPEVLFTGPYHAPAFSTNDSVLYFDVIGGAYYSELGESGWSDPAEFDEPYHYLCQTNSGQHYASVTNAENGLGLLDIATISFDGPNISLGAPINTSGHDAGFGISADETVIACATRQGLALSVKKNDDQWTEPYLLNNSINNSTYENSGLYVTDDNKYVFFSRYTKYSYTNGKRYWANIESLVDSLMNYNLSIDNSESENENFRIYPNPASDELYIKYSSNNAIYYSLVSLNGKIILQGKPETNNTINVSNLRKGVYILHVICNGSIFTYKVIIE